MSNRLPTSIALGLVLMLLWLTTHRYQGIAQDARIYAMQAIARMNPALEADLYLKNTSQDRFTIFSPFYAEVIRRVGLTEAARWMTVLFTVGFLSAAWALTQRLLGQREAWLGVGLLIVAAGTYGSFGVFHVFDDYLTARLPAQALVAAALAADARGLPRLAFSTALGAMFVHPLMALPGLLTLVFLHLPARAAIAAAIVGIGSVMAIALGSVLPGVPRFFPLIDAAWLLVVRERSQFLFLQLWSWHDWEINLRPFASLALSAAMFTDARVRKFCVAAALVGASGLVVAAVSGTVGPVAILLQGQAWRWIWITMFIAALFGLPTAVRLWQDSKCGPLCAVLLVVSWTSSLSGAPLCGFAACALFLTREHIPDEVTRHLRSAALVLGLAIICWATVGVFRAASSTSATSAAESLLQRAGTASAARLPLVVVFFIAWHLIRMPRSRRITAAVCVILTVACVWLVPAAFNKKETAGSPAEILEFADWRRAIPPSQNIYVANGHDSPSFAWFTLGRPSYLSLDQSAGVVFSRATALEVERRSEVLRPLMSEDWKLLSKNQAASVSSSIPGSKPPPPAKLTATSLIEICRDPALGFLAARENVGFDPLRHVANGPWKDWNLYDCSHVRNQVPAA